MKRFGERFCALFCVFAAIHALTPFALYRNPYTVAVMAFFALCAASRAAFGPQPGGSAGPVSPAGAFRAPEFRADPALLLYFCAVAASGVFSLFGAGAGLASATTATLYITSILFAFLVPCFFAERRRLTALAAVIALSATVISFYGIMQYMRGVPIDVTQTDQQTGGASLAMGRVDATLGNPNVLAGWLVLAIPFGVSLFFGARGLSKKVLAALAVGPCVLCLLLTQSRSGWVGLAAAAATYLFLLEWRLVPALAAAGALSVPFWPKFILDRLLTTGADTSSVYRLTIWAGSFRMAVGNFFTGIGIGLEYFRRFINNYVYFPYETAPVHSHMLPLQIWLESGIFAAAAFIWFVFRMMKKGTALVFSYRREHANQGGASLSQSMSSRKGASLGQRVPLGQQGMRLMLTASVSGFMGFLAMGVFEYVWFFPRCMNMFFIAAGMFVCSLRIEGARAPIKG
jgi:O-antigen ligase